MRKYVSKLVSIILAVALVCSIGIVSASADYQAHVSGEGVNFRKGPGTSYAVMGAYCYGTPVTVLEEYNGWCKVTIFNVTGWMYGAYITRGVRPEAPVTLDTTAQGTAGYVNTSNVNLRLGPGISHASIGTLPMGTEVMILDYLSNGWYGVMVNGYPGFIFGDYVTEGSYTAGSELIQPAALPAATTQYANTNGVVVRIAPNQSATAIATLPIYTEVEIVTAYSNGWYGITFTNLLGAGMSGYVYKEYLNDSPTIIDDIVLTPSAASGTVYVIKDKADFRVGPDESLPSGRQFKLGDTLTLIQQFVNKDGVVLWYQAQASDGVIGYIYASHVSANKSDVSNPNLLYIVKDYSSSPVNTIVSTNNATFYTVNGEVAGYLAYGTDVQVVAVYSNGLASVIISAGPGWISRYDLDLP